MTRTICSRCGGNGGQPANQVDPTERAEAWHPCYHCRTIGYCECRECRSETIEETLTPREQELWEQYQKEMDKPQPDPSAETIRDEDIPF